MVKRAPTPPPADDEPRVLVVTHPYPPNPNLERHKDLLCFVFWLVCCMGEDHFGDLYSICHKPTAADMVLIEVRRGFEGYRRLLGAHKWSEFVRNPGPLKDSVSRIYFSTLANGRAVEKAGWKRVFIEDEWFKQFNVKNRHIMYPYPSTSYCLPPPEDKTTGNICRPLPLEMFNMRMPTPPSIPVGSPQWVAHKEADMATTCAAPPKRSYAAISLGGSARSSTPVSSAKSLQSSRSPARPLSGVRQSSDIGPPPGLADIGPPPGLVQKSETGSITMVDGTLLSEPNDVDIGDYVGKLEVTSPFEDFGTFTITPHTKEPEKPICPTHGIVCKKGVCQDYRNLLKRIERQKNGGGRGRYTGRGASPRRGSTSYRARGTRGGQ